MTKLFSLESYLGELKAGTTGATTVAGTIYDTDGYENVRFLGYIEATGTTTQLVARGGSATASLTEYTGPSQGEASGTQKNLYLDIHRPKLRYIQGVIYASAAMNTLLVSELYGPRTSPTTNATTINGRQLFSPNTGTATATG